MKTLLTAITYIFQPLLIPTYCIILLFQLDIFLMLPLGYKLSIIGGTIICTLILPAIPILVMMKKGKIKDIFISNRRERTIPYLVTIFAYTLWLFFLSKARFSIPFIVVASGSLFSIVGMILVNFKWKISAHTAGMGGFLGSIVSISYLTYTLPSLLIISIIILSGLVAISRIELKAHTPKQIAGGFVWGFSCCTIPASILLFF